MEIVLHPLIYITACTICALSFKTNNNKWLKVLICILLTPFLGYFLLRYTGKRNDVKEEITHYYCERCDLEFTQTEYFCPVCLKEGIETKLTPRVVKAL